MQVHESKMYPQTKNRHFLDKGIVFNDLFSSGDFDQTYSFIGMVSVISTKKLKYIVQFVMMKATPWKDTRKTQRGSQEIVRPRI
jgi:hypothetical protein